MSGRIQRTALFLLLACALFLGVRAAVLTTITINGNMNDWSAVLADPWQTTFDGPAMGLADLDAPVQSTGRDLMSFAWTYDTGYFYMYLSRTGSSSNKQLFWYYLDINFDGLMQSGEPVFHVAWWGNTRRTRTYLYTYNAVNAGGDPMADGSANADGWTMPGTLSGGTALENVKGGSSSGIEMESRISWAQLGVPSGTPFHFHVSSSNSANLPTQIDDNLGGPGGSIGTTALIGVVLSPDRSITAVPAGSAVFDHLLSNTGSAPDRFDLTWTASGDFTPAAVDFYHDTNGDGRLDGGDVLLTDTDASGRPDSGLLTAGATLDLLVVAGVPAGPAESDSSAIVVTATSALNNLESDDCTDTVTIASPDITLVKSVDLTSATPGVLLTYTIDYTSSGSSDAYNSVIVDSVPADTVYETGSASGAGAIIEYSHDGGLAFDASEAAPVTHVRWRFASPLAPGAGGTVSFGARIL